MSKNINFFLEKSNFFYQYIWKYQHFDKNIIFGITLKKIVFCPYLRKYQNSRKKYMSLDPFEKLTFCPCVQKYQIFLEKSNFFYQYIRKYQYFEKNVIFGITLKKLFLSISPKISKFKEKVLAFRSLWKIKFLSMYPKIQKPKN